MKEKGINTNHETDLFSQLIKDKLDGHELPLPENGWAEIETRLHKKRKRISLWAWSSGVAVVAACLTLLLVLPTFYNTEIQNIADQELPVEEVFSPSIASVQPELVDKNIIIQPEQAVEENIAETPKPQTAVVVAHNGTLVNTHTKEEAHIITSDIQLENDEVFAEDIQTTKSGENTKQEKTSTPKKEKQEFNLIPSAANDWTTKIKKKKQQNGWQLAANFDPGGSYGASSKPPLFDTNGGWSKDPQFPVDPQPNPPDNSNQYPNIVEENLAESTVGEEPWPGESENYYDNSIKYDKLLLDNAIENDYPASDYLEASNSQNGGSSISHPPGANDYPVKTHLPPFSVGVSVRKDINRIFGIESGLTYTFLMSKFEMVGNSNQHATSRQHYLGIPLNVSANILNTSHWNIYVSAGGMLEKGLQSEWTQYVGEKSRTTSSKINGVQWSVNASVGATYKFHKKMGVYLEPKFSYYFDNDQPVSIRTDKPIIIGVNLGLRYQF